MTTADWALIVSIFSFIVSAGGFVWNVWSKFIYPKAKVRAYIGVYLVMDGDGSPARKFIQLSATNYGPTEVTLHSHQAKRQQGFLWFKRNHTLALINPIAHPDSDQPTGWFAPGFPKKLSIGEGVNVNFSREAPKRWVEEANLYYFGFSDTFGRYHWCSRKNAKKFRVGVIKNFGAVPPVRQIWFRHRQDVAARLWLRYISPLARRLRRSP